MKQRVKELFKNTAIIGIGRISTQMISFLLIPLYSNILSTEEYGIFDLYSSGVSLMLPLVTLQIELAAYKYIITNRNDINRIKVLFSTAVMFIAIGLTIVFIGSRILNRVLFVENIQLLFWYLFTSVIFILENNIVRAFGDNINYTISSVIVSVCTIILNIVTLCEFDMGVTGLLISVIAANFFGALYLLLKNRLYSFFSFSLISVKELKCMLKYSLPLIPNELSWWVIKGSDRMIVAYILGTSFNGILAMGTKFANIFQSIVNIFITAWTENAILYYEKGKEDFNKLVNQLICLFGWIAVFAVHGIGFLFPFMVSEAFEQAYELIPLYIIAVYIYCLGGIFGAVYLAENRTVDVTISTIIAGIVNFIMDIMLVKRIGIYAAPIASILGYAMMTYYRINHLKDKKKFKLKKNIVVFLLAGFIFSLVGYLGKNPVKIVTLLGCVILFAINYHDLIDFVIKSRR